MRPVEMDFQVQPVVDEEQRGRRVGFAVEADALARAREAHGAAAAVSCQVSIRYWTSRMALASRGMA